MLTDKKIEVYQEILEEIESKLIEILPLYCDLIGEKVQGSFESFEIEKGDIFVVTERYWGGETDCRHYKIPLSYLYDDNWMVELKEEMRIKKEIELTEKECKRVESEKLKNIKEKELYEKLKSKFETN